jgi:hypothetical protein
MGGGAGKKCGHMGFSLGHLAAGLGIMVVIFTDSSVDINNVHCARTRKKVGGKTQHSIIIWEMGTRHIFVYERRKNGAAFLSGIEGERILEEREVLLDCNCLIQAFGVVVSLFAHFCGASAQVLDICVDNT